MKGPLNRDEGRPNFKRHLEAEQDITPLSPQELQVEVDKRKAAAPWDVPIKTVYEDPSVQEEFKNLLKDPVLAHVADLATYDFKVAQAKRFGTFKHRVQATMASQMLQRPTEEIDYLHQIPLPEHTNSPLLDIYEFEDPDEDVSAPKWKIQPNLYDDNTVEIIEDESTSYSPTLTEEYNQGNAFFAMGTNDPVLNKKLEYANKKLEEIMRYPNLDKVKQEIKLSMWSQHLLDEKMLDTIAGEQVETKNLIENKTPEAPLSYEPLQTYTHYEELVNDLLAKLLPDDGFLRLDPGWKWNVLETGTKVLRCVPLHDYPTEPFHFPDGVLVMRVAKFLKVRDTYLDPVAVSKEIDRLNTRDWVLQKYYGKEADEKDEAKYAYLREGILDRFLLINLRFGTFSVATFTDKVDPTPTEWNPDIEKTKNLFLSNSEILRKTKEDTDIAHMTAYRLPPDWILAIKRTKFPIFAGTGLNSPERRIHGAMKILGRMERDDSPMRADMSEFAQNLPHRMETDHPYISDVMAHQYYEQFPDHQRT